MTPATMPSDERIHQLLHDFLVARLGSAARPRLAGLARVATGRSRENWLVDLSWFEPAAPPRAQPADVPENPPDAGSREPGPEREHTEPLIVRLDPEGGLLETDRATEFAVLAALARSDLPAPTPRWLDPTGQELGRPALLMVREPGECDYFVVNGERPLEERVRLARRFCELLAHVHRLDWHDLGLGEALSDPGPGRAAGHELEQWQAILRRDQLEAYPELELAAWWLARHAPTNTRTTLVHGDFKPGNVLLVDGEPGALLDWELAHLGDPHEDLGWVTQPLRTREHLIPGAWEREDLFQHYEAVTGWELDRHAIVWWNVLACYKTAVMQVSGLRSYIEGRADELYQPTAAVLLALLDAVEGRS
ncbi:MAG: phosphotransferase family protein [Acidimicrobiales bacterium]